MGKRILIGVGVVLMWGAAFLAAVALAAGLKGCGSVWPLAGLTLRTPASQDSAATAWTDALQVSLRETNRESSTSRQAAVALAKTIADSDAKDSEIEARYVLLTQPNLRVRGSEKGLVDHPVWVVIVPGARMLTHGGPVRPGTNVPNNERSPVVVGEKVVVIDDDNGEALETYGHAKWADQP
ncbi:MAG: hypothetical protein HY876_11010 [Coriobacteriales bacterium]|nr:hypothetical protein [Coriobacteriales bacterium]